MYVFGKMLECNEIVFFLIQDKKHSISESSGRQDKTLQKVTNPFLTGCMVTLDCTCHTVKNLNR